MDSAQSRKKRHPLERFWVTSIQGDAAFHDACFIGSLFQSNDCRMKTVLSSAGRIRLI
jgi:hypothetical protein